MQRYARLALTVVTLAILCLVVGGCIQVVVPTQEQQVSSKPVINSFEANPSDITAGAATMLKWSVANATNVSIDPNIGNVTLSGSVSVSPGTTTIYTLTATSASGSVTATTQVRVSGIQPPPVNTGLPVISLFTAAPTSISAGSSSLLSWSVSNATSVNISPTIGIVGNSGNTYVSPATTITYTLTASNAAGSAVSTVQIAVTSASPPPLTGIPTINSFTANPPMVSAGGSTILSWSVSNANSVTITGIGSVNDTGNISIMPSTTTSYTLTAVNNAGMRSRTIAVAVVSQPSPPPVQQLNWSGTWDTSYNNMYLTQTGNQVVGTYAYEGGKIVGTVSGNVLTGTWSESPTYALPNDTGSFQFTMSLDYNSFTGVWRHGFSGAMDHSWNGTRVSP